VQPWEDASDVDEVVHLNVDVEMLVVQEKE
jgi:hypothetical protein